LVNRANLIIMRNLVYLLVAVIICTSCEREKVSVPSLEVSVTSATYKAGDTVTFNFKGNPDNITFYSGEPGHQYEHRDRTTDSIKPDEGIALKNISTVLPSYKYVYTVPGAYKAVFDVSAVRYNGERRTTKEIALTITP
jgi:hypothetical protein